MLVDRQRLPGRGGADHDLLTGQRRAVETDIGDRAAARRHVDGLAGVVEADIIHLDGARTGGNLNLIAPVVLGHITFAGPGHANDRALQRIPGAYVEHAARDRGPALLAAGSGRGLLRLNRACCQSGKCGGREQGKGLAAGQIRHGCSLW